MTGFVLPLAFFALAALFYAVGAIVIRRSFRNLAPGVRPADATWSPATRFDHEGWRRLEALYTPRGWRIRRAGMLLVLLCGLMIVLGVIAAL